MAALAGPITPDAVLSYYEPTDGYLCKLQDNDYGIEFLEFEIKDYDTSTSLYKVAKDPSEPPMDPSEIPPEHEELYRTVRYQFPREFLRYQTVRTALVFRVGAREVPNFRMIERHYFKDRLLRSYDFTFGFCIPDSTNSWEAIYPMPGNTPEEEAEMIGTPNGHRSDSFYFVGDRLVMHNKAEYSYI